jgi:hypothetical protein
MTADAKNWVRVWNKPTESFGVSADRVLAFIPFDVRKRIKGKGEKQQIKIVEKYLREQKSLMRFLPHAASALQMVWDKTEPRFFKALSKLTHKPVSSKMFKAELTTASLCPYNTQHNWFMVDAYASLGRQVTVVAHEIFHLEVLRWYQKECFEQGLSEKQFEDLKEALTVLLNGSEFEDVLVCPDHGYEKHIDLRIAIEKQWKKKADFETLLKKIIQQMRQAKTTHD